MKERLMNDLKEAMKNREIIRKNTIQLIRAAILQQEKDKQTEMTDIDIMELIAKQVKDRTNALAEFEKADRLDLIEETVIELEVLKSYLPKELTESELKKLIVSTAAQLNITEKKQMGQLIKAVKIQAIGADGKLISDLVKEYLK